MGNILVQSIYIICLDRRTILLAVALAFCSHVIEATGLCTFAAMYSRALTTSSIHTAPDVITTVDPEVGNWTEWNQHLYLLVNTATDWDQASTMCQEKHSDAHLVYIESAGENKFVHSMLTESDMDVWIGLTDTDEEGTWKWGSSAADFFVWSNWSNEPDGGTRENCAVKIQSSEEWYDYECHQELYFMCEREFS